MNTKHTPSPWRIGDGGATIFGPKTDAPAPVRIATITNSAMPSEEQRANAYLVKASPDLLKAATEAEEALGMSLQYLRDNLQSIWRTGGKADAAECEPCLAHQPVGHVQLER